MAKSPFSSFPPPEVLNTIVEQAGKFLPGDKSRDEIHRSVQLIVQNALAKLDIVTREEFDAQTAVLQKTRQKVEQLETQMLELTTLLEAARNDSAK